MVVDTFQGYFDESYDSEVMVIAGFLGSPEQWAPLYAPWKRVLDDYELQFFHMKEFAHFQGQFKGWSETRRRQCLQRLLDIIKGCVSLCTGVVIPQQAFDQVISDDVKRFCGGAYGLAAHLLFMDIADPLAKMQPNARVDYRFESGAIGRHQILEVFNQNMKTPRLKEEFRLLGLDFYDKRDFLPLQAADILAYECFKHYPNRGFHSSNTRYPLKQLTQPPFKFRWNVYEVGSLAQMNTLLSVKIAEL